MRIYVGFDDTDVLGSDRGTGKLARWFEQKLPDSCRMWGVVRQQLPRMEGIPFTSHNSSACVVVDTDHDLSEEMIRLASAHIQEHYIEGSDPGLCVVPENSPAISDLVQFGKVCCSRVVTQKEAMMAAGPAHLSGHGGTNDGIIGAAAGVGLTITGWSGRFVEFGRLRDCPDMVSVDWFEKKGIKVLSMDRNALVPWRDHKVETFGKIRPRLWGFGPVLPVIQKDHQTWQVVGMKKNESAIPRE